MGLGESEASIDKLSAVACSICLEAVAGDGDRSTARLQCGHEFHLDCIGSAFNAKGTMQCPNCRKVEKGNWLYANGSCSHPEPSFDEWLDPEELFDSYTELMVGVPWCPFSRLARLPPPFESASRLAGSFVSSLGPPYLTTSSRPHGYVRDHYQHHNNHPGMHASMFLGPHRSTAPPSTLAPVGPTPPSLPDQTTYYLFPPASSSRAQQEPEPMGDRFYSWERDRFAPFPLLPVPVEGDSGWWRPFPRSGGSSDSGSQPGFWHWNGNVVERPSSQARTESSSYRPPHNSRTRPYM